MPQRVVRRRCRRLSCKDQEHAGEANPLHHLLSSNRFEHTVTPPPLYTKNANAYVTGVRGLVPERERTV